MKTSNRTQRNIVFATFLIVLAFLFFPLFNPGVSQTDGAMIAHPSNEKIRIAPTAKDAESVGKTTLEK